MFPGDTRVIRIKIHDWTRYLSWGEEREVADPRALVMPATIKDIIDSYRRLNTKAAVTVFLIYDVAFAMVMPV